jgi:hypothetical protein
MLGGESTRQGEVGHLGEEMSSGCPPGVRQRVGSQVAVDRGRWELDKVSGVLGKAQA